MKFSVVTPVFNGLPKIEQCIGSVKGQKTDDIKIEHIVQDGGSTDGSVAWLTDFEKRNDQKNYTISFTSQSDKGIYDAINKGWGRSKGDILSWLNADEQYLPGTLKKVANLFNQNPTVDIFFGDSIIVDSHGFPLAARREIPLRKIYVRNGFLYSFSCTLFFRRKLLDSKLLSFDIQYKRAGDMDLMLKLLDQNIRIEHIPSYLSLFGVDGNNLSTDGLMKSETLEIRRKYGGLPLRLAQRFILIGRYIERLLSGCYKFDMVSYDYALDEKPSYRTIPATKIGFRFLYKKVLKKLGKH